MPKSALGSAIDSFIIRKTKVGLIDEGRRLQGGSGCSRHGASLRRCVQSAWTAVMIRFSAPDRRPAMPTEAA